MPGPSGEQVPDWVVSTPWQLPLHQLIQCLEVHAKDTGLTEEGGKYWISAVSNNQHELAVLGRKFGNLHVYGW